MSDQAPAELLAKIATSRDRVVMEQIEEFEYGASLEFYSGHHLLMVKRHGLPQFPYPVPPEQDYLITPEQLQAWWQGPERVFLLVDDATPLEPFLQKARVVLTMPSKRLLVNRP